MRELRNNRWLFVLLILTFQYALPAKAAVATVPIVRVLNYVAGTVRDSLGRPLAHVALTLQNSDGQNISSSTSDERGYFRLSSNKQGIYMVVAQKAGFATATKLVVSSKQPGVRCNLVLEAKEALTLAVSTNRLHPQNGLSVSGTNKYTLSAKDIANLPLGQSTPLNQVMLQMPGVALDQNQEIHIRGEHMGIQYQLNGIMLPLDINTDPTFTQLLNAYFVKNVSLIDGILPAQYGFRTSGVIDIHTKDGCDNNHNEFNASGGQRDTAQGSFQIGGCNGDLSYYLTGLFLQSNLCFSSAVPSPDPIHDAATQGQSFGYLTYELSPTTKLSLITGMTLSFNQFPNQAGLTPQYQLAHVNPALHPSSDINSGLNQQDYYGVVAFNGAAGSAIDYQLAYTTHYNSQSFYPDPVSDLIYEGIASNVFTSGLSNTIQGDLTYRIGNHSLRSGLYLGEYGVESDQSSFVFPIGSNGSPATIPALRVANLNKINLVYGIYLQDAWKISEKLSVNFGSRWDRVTGFTAASQFSPTINFLYKATRDTALHAGFARNFQVPNFQNVSSGIYRLFAGTTGALRTSPDGNTSPLTETDYTWDAGFTHQYTPRLAFAQDNYFRIDRHYLDEGQIRFRTDRSALQLRSWLWRRNRKLINVQSWKFLDPGEHLCCEGRRYRCRIRTI